MQHRLPGNRRLWIAAFALLFVALGCAILGGPVPKAPPQGWLQSRGPVVPHDTFPTDCRLCHVTGSWHEIRDDFQFDHAAQTGVELRGAHEQAECLRCHNDKGPVQQFASRGCAGCHEDWHRRQLGTACADCHTEVSWVAKEQIVRHNRTRLPLIGAHAGVACWRCHEGAQVGNFKRASVDCASCHQDDLATATSPNHAAAGWTRDCQRCHVPIAWSGSAFAHGFFPLTGAHAALDCAQCHGGGVYRGTPRTCVGCHLDDYNQTTSPNHASSGFPTTCEQCHNTSSWQGAVFNHRFPLVQEHNVACAVCHTNPGNFRAYSCFSCHEHSRAEMDDKHQEVNGYVYTSTACVSCHPNGR